jgi:hypothetical protein
MTITSILRANRRNSAYGAPMGDSGYINYDQPESGLRCQRLDMVDGDYGPDGTYWGCGSYNSGHMYVIFNGANPEFKTACGLLKYYRAKNRDSAIALFLEDYPEFSFSRMASHAQN